MQEAIRSWMSVPGTAITPKGAAELLRVELERLGVPADVRDGYRLGLVLVRGVDLVVWCDLATRSYRWCTGRTSGQRVYAFCPVNDPVTAARRVAGRYVELRGDHPHSELIKRALT